MSLAQHPILEVKPQTPLPVVPAAAMKGFLLIMSAWGVSAEEARLLLGSPAARTYYAWRSGTVARIPFDTLRRIGYVAGIYKALQILYSDPQLADTWVKRPNADFGDQSPLQRMKAGDVTDLAAVRNYLDAARGLWS